MTVLIISLIIPIFESILSQWVYVDFLDLKSMTTKCVHMPLYSSTKSFRTLTLNMQYIICVVWYIQ